MAEGLRKTIAMSTDTRAAKKLERVFVDLSGKMAYQVLGGNGTHFLYGMIIHDSHECIF